MEKNSNIFLVMLIGIMVLLSGYILYRIFNISTDETPTSETPILTPEIKDDTNTNDNKNENKSDNKINNNTNTNTNNNTSIKSGVYKTPSLIKDSSDDGLLVLKTDGSFIYSASAKGCYSPLLGTYSSSKNTIKFKAVVSYGCDGCYYRKDSFSDFSGEIKDGNIIIKEERQNSKGKYKIVTSTYKLDKNTSLSKYNDSWYVLKPKDGVKPQGKDEAWVDCTSLVSK